MKIRPSVKKAVLLFLFPVLLGTGFATSFAPYSLSWLSVFVLAVFIFALWRLERPADAFSFAFSFGLGWFSLGLSWTMNSMAVHGRLPWVAAFAGLLLLAALLSLLPAVAAWFSKKLSGRAGEFPFLFAGLFLFAEWLRGDLLFNFGWLTPAYAAIDTPWAFWATLGGVYAVNLAVVFSAALLASFSVRFYERRKGFAELAAFFLILASALGIKAVEWSHPGPDLEVRLFQPSLPVVDAWSRVRPSERIKALYPSAESPWTTSEPRLAITPEGVVNSLIERLDVDSLQALSLLQKKVEAPLLFNGFRHEAKAFFNTEFVLDQSGLTYQLDKRHLVPFGEFVPSGARWFVDMLGIPMSDLKPGSTSQPYLKVGDVTVGILICYENLYGNLVRQDVYSGQPDVVVVTANLGWFGSSVLKQHLDMSRMRAIEIARPLVQVSNTGMSAIVSRKGQVETLLAAEGADSLTATVSGRVGSPTPYGRFGDFLALITTGLLLILAFFRRHRRLREKIFFH